MIPANATELLSQFAADPRLLPTLLCCSAVSLTLILTALKWVRQSQIQRKTEQAKKRKENALKLMEQAIKRFKQKNPSVEPETILSLSLVELAGRLQNGSLSPESVLYTYMGKALDLNREVNCVSHFLQECESQLEELKKQKEKGPLYGIPVSIKQSIPCKGYDSSCGLLQFHDALDLQDSVMVQVLKNLGAIPFVKTNVPQSLICFDSSNPIYGQTLNPLNHKKTSAGSSGGEGSLIGGGGSIIGLGSDMAGSIRFPASFCGLCGLSPTAFRLSSMGMHAPIDGQIAVLTVIGPMAKDVDSLTLFMRAVLCEDLFRLDPTVPPLRFNEEVYSSSKPLRIGYYDTIDYFPSTPSMRRVVQETKLLLEEAGHTLVPFSPPEMDGNLFDLFSKLFFADGGSTYLDKFKGNLIDPHLKRIVQISKVPLFIKRILGMLLRPISPRIASNLTALSSTRSVKTLWENQTKQQDYRQAFISEWNKLNLDVVLCPMMGPAFNIGIPGELLVAFCHTVLYNVLNFPSGVVPVSTVTQDDEEKMKNYTGPHIDLWDRTMKKGVEGGVGLPLSVQCVALPWQEELCLRLMKEIETLTAAKKRK